MPDINDQFLSIGDACRRLSRDLILLADASAAHIQRVANHDPSKVNPNFVDEILPPKKVAVMLSVSMSSLEKWRKEGRGPAFFKLDGQRFVRYRRSDVLKFMASSQVRHD